MVAADDDDDDEAPAPAKKPAAKKGTFYNWQKDLLYLNTNDSFTLHLFSLDDSDDEAPAPKKPTSAKKKGMFYFGKKSCVSLFSTCIWVTNHLCTSSFVSPPPLPH